MLRLSSRTAMLALAALTGCGARSELRSPRLDAAVDAPLTVDVRDAGPRLRATLIAAGARHACASLTDGTTRCWGANDSGQLGDGTTRDALRPVFTRLPDGAARLACGDQHSCGQGPGGGVFCWGANESGQLGDGTFEPRSEPVRVLVAGVTEMSLGRAHSMFRIEDGNARAFGANALCQLGEPARPMADPTPQIVPGLRDLVAIGAGGDFSCGVGRNRTILCAGTLDSGAPTWCAVNDVPGIDTALDVAVGAHHACLHNRDDHIFCRGANDSGQLGDATRMRHDSWVVVPLPGAATHVAAGAAHTCAILADGSIMCWGSNARGELGTDGGMDALSPINVSIGGPATALALGESFSCALRNDGAVMCWGLNARGQLGDGTTITRSMPEAVVF